jgi:hypothetical protein
MVFNKFVSVKREARPYDKRIGIVVDRFYRSWIIGTLFLTWNKRVYEIWV